MDLKRARLPFVVVFALSVLCLPSARQVEAQATVETGSLDIPVECFPLNPPFTGWQVCTWVKGRYHLVATPRGNEIFVTKAYGCFDFKNPQGQVVESSCETDIDGSVWRAGQGLQVYHINVKQTNTSPGAICEVHYGTTLVRGRPTADFEQVRCTPT